MDYHHLLEATGIVVSGVLFYSLAYGWFAPDDPRRRTLWTIVLGLAWGAIAVALMISRIQTKEGIFIDGRVIPIALIGLFEGWGAALITGLAATVYRVYLGGSGAGAGVITILGVAVAGGLAHRWAGGTERVRIHHAFVLAVGTFFITFGGFGLLGERGQALFAQVWPSYLVLTVVGLPMLALLMQSIVERWVLARERERFRAVLDDATDAVRIVDADTQRILDCNHADCELSGYSRDAMLGRDSRQFWPESVPGRGAREEPAPEARPAGLARALGVPFLTASGRTLAVDCTRRVVAYRGRRYEIVIYRDAAERLAGEEARREAASLRSVNLLAQAAAHEINNPLAIIMGYSQMLEDRLAAESEEGVWARTSRQAAVRIRDAVARLGRIVRIEPLEPTGPLPPILDTERSAEKRDDDARR
ncbi:MAG TPA: LytS/YhcK type 5TM receptor domain-containing protein [Candidatus Deferrimicrobiaceae bacterium]|nr:LytS/YhcK type 5TM receptor domain-containing protein [Candidatus Deferrimicrobiaceae bacterium]